MTSPEEPTPSIRRPRARGRLAARIRALRLRHRWSQEVLARLSGLHRSYIGSVERAERNISLDNIEKIADAFRIPVHELLRAQTGLQGTAAAGREEATVR